MQTPWPQLCSCTLLCPRGTVFKSLLKQHSEYFYSDKVSGVLGAGKRFSEIWTPGKSPFGILYRRYSGIREIRFGKIGGSQERCWTICH